MKQTTMTKPDKQVATSAPATAPMIAGKPSLVMRMAARYQVDADKMLDTLKATAFKQRGDKMVSNEQMLALLVVADQYHLNPFTREIYAFPSENGIVPIISVDGWIRLINERPELESIQFRYAEDGDENPWIECTIERKDRSMPVSIREYLVECARDTGPWKSHPRRMLRHKTLIQCARIAFGFADVFDPDEGERIVASVEAGAHSAKPATVEPKAIEHAPAAATAPPAKVHNEVPIAELRDALDAEGIPESALFARFEIGGFEELPLDKVSAAFEWIRTCNAPQ